jgi:sugar lactone lactonase YvrE
MTAMLVACGGGGISGPLVNYSTISGIALDNTASPSKLIITNAGKQTIQSVLLSSDSVTTLAGTTNTSGTADGTGAAARFDEPVGITLSGFDYYVADAGSHTIRKVTSAGVVTTLAGLAGTTGVTNGTGTAALFNLPKGLVSDGTNLYVADTNNHAIRQVVIGSGTFNTGVVTTLAGYTGTPGTSNGTGSTAGFNYPYGITYDGSANLYVTDSGNHAIRKIVASNGFVSTLAGTIGTAGIANGIGVAATFNSPGGIVSDPSNRDVLYVADSLNHTIRKIVISTTTVTTPYGAAGVAGAIDANGTSARFNYPTGLTIDSSGNLYVTDQNFTKVRKINTSTGDVTTLSASF